MVKTVGGDRKWEDGIRKNKRTVLTQGMIWRMDIRGPPIELMVSVPNLEHMCHGKYPGDLIF